MSESKPRENMREFELQFDKRTCDWSVIVQSTIKTDDGYHTRVIEIDAFNQAIARIAELEKELFIEKDSHKQAEIHHGVIRRKLKDLIKELERQNKIMKEQLSRSWPGEYGMFVDASNAAALRECEATTQSGGEKEGVK